MKQTTFEFRCRQSGRQESAEMCAERICTFMNALADLDASYSEWFLMGKRSKNMRRLSFSKETMREILEKKRARDDTRYGIVEGCGYSFGAWSGVTDEELATFTVRCGAEATTTIAQPNGLQLTVPSSTEIRNRLLTIDMVASIMANIIRVWEPTSAFLLSRCDNEMGKETTYLRLATYSPDALATLPDRAFSVPLESGNIIYVSGNVQLGCCQNHVAVAKHLNQILPSLEMFSA